MCLGEEEAAYSATVAGCLMEVGCRLAVAIDVDDDDAEWKGSAYQETGPVAFGREAVAAARLGPGLSVPVTSDRAMTVPV